MRLKLLGIGLLLCPLLTFGQDSLRKKKVKILPVPTFGYEPETRTKVGAVSLFALDFYQDGLTRTSNAKVEFNYTWRKQSVFEIEWDYFFREEAWFTKGRIHFSKYPDFFYGIGANSLERNELLFESNRVIVDIGQFKNLGNQLFAGLGLRYLSYQRLGEIPEVPIYESLVNSETLGLKGAIFADTRNNLLNSTEGKYYLLELGLNWGDRQYTQIKTDARRYFSWKQNTIALRLYNAFTINTPTFYDYAIMGGDDFVRGYFFGRFRDNNLSTLQAEYRTHLVWKIGGAVFGGLSSLYPDLDSFTDRFRPNYGAGIRFLVDKEGNTNLRLDYALGTTDQSGFYISFGESF